MASLRTRVAALFITILFITSSLFILVSSRDQKADAGEVVGGEKNLHAVSAFVKAKINSGQVVIFSKSYCPYCMGAKRLFTEMGQTYQAIELDKLGSYKKGVMGF